MHQTKQMIILVSAEWYWMLQYMVYCLQGVILNIYICIYIFKMFAYIYMLNFCVYCTWWCVVVLFGCHVCLCQGVKYSRNSLCFYQRGMSVFLIGEICSSYPSTSFKRLICMLKIQNQELRTFLWTHTIFYF